MSRPENDLPYIDIQTKYPGTFFGPSPLNAMYCNSPDSMGGFSNPANQQCFSLRSTPSPESLAEKENNKTDRAWMADLYDFE